MQWVDTDKILLQLNSSLTKLSKASSPRPYRQSSFKAAELQKEKQQQREWWLELVVRPINEASNVSIFWISKKVYGRQKAIVPQKSRNSGGISEMIIYNHGVCFYRKSNTLSSPKWSTSAWQMAILCSYRLWGGRGLARYSLSVGGLQSKKRLIWFPLSNNVLQLYRKQAIKYLPPRGDISGFNKCLNRRLLHSEQTWPNARSIVVSSLLYAALYSRWEGVRRSRRGKTHAM